MAEIFNETWFEDEVATFGDRLEAARLAAGLSAEDLAQRLGVRDSTITAWEADAWEPRGNRLQMLAGMLNVSLMWLMTGKGPGLGAPGDADALPYSARMALADIAQLRAQMQTLGRDLLRAEQKLEAELRELAA
ncbi:transcriptional regulator [Cypionkella aquatica]|uniref:Transcriptional regulator n=1 Tax=Cypionkella aquatica TaxID=1756042 RepID=A0AA37TRL2_9RHOB|nr:helix-turn-helix domain-containing protein [Cypionkella aquatica]GLS86459.1 transcriptional regulator [Cypionkella aquatica]